LSSGYGIIAFELSALSYELYSRAFQHCAFVFLAPPFLSLCLKSGFELHYMV